MLFHTTARPGVTAVALSASAILVGALALAAPAPVAPTAARLTNPVKVTLTGVEIDAIAALADNESVVVVGSKPRGSGDEERKIEEVPPAGAIVNLRTRAVRPFTNGHKASIKGVAVSADGSRIVTVCSSLDPSVRVWDIKAAAPLAPVQLPRLDEINTLKYGVAALPGGLKVAVGYQENLALLDTAGRERRRDLKGGGLADNEIPENLTVSPNGKLLACRSYGNKLLVWDIQAGKVVRSANLLPAGQDPKEWQVYELAFTQNGKGLLVCGCGNTDEVPKGTAGGGNAPRGGGMHLIGVCGGKVTPLGMGHQIHTFSFAQHPSGEWLATVGPSRPDKPADKEKPGQVGELRIYHYPTRSLTLRVQFNQNEFFPFCVRFTPNGRKLVAVDAVGKLRAWDFTPGNKK